jgi:hypothetical protein
MITSVPPITDSRVAGYFAQTDSAQTELLMACRELIFQTLPEIKEVWKWNVPTYGLKKLICYLRKTKTHVTFGFYNGSALNDNYGKLFGGDNPTMRHLKLRGFEDFDTELIAGLLRQSAEING